MAQFTVYRSTDGSAPTLTGEVGSLLNLFQKCLVDGYGAKAAAGWTNPVASAGDIGSFKMGAGTQMAFVLNDNGPNGTSTYKEAWATGWGSVAGVGAPVGTGTVQFPLPSQLLTTGHVVIRKSAAASNAQRVWCMFADNRTMYFFAQTGDTANQYLSFVFGEFYSYYTGTDVGNCIIIGRETENSGAETVGNLHSTNNGALAGIYLARGFSGTYQSLTCGLLSEGYFGDPSYCFGNMQCPNGADGNYHVAPKWIYEINPYTNVLRGHLRGLYKPLHAASNFTDAQAIDGSTADYNGRTFSVVKFCPTAANPGCFFMETSNTLDTN